MKLDDISMMGQHHGPWMHVQKRGMRKYGKGGFAGIKDEGNSDSRFDVLVNLDENWNDDGNPVVNGLNKNIHVVEGEEKELISENGQGTRANKQKNHMGKRKEVIKRDFVWQKVEKGNGKDQVFNQGILKEISRNNIQIRPSIIVMTSPGLVMKVLSKLSPTMSLTSRPSPTMLATPRPGPVRIVIYRPGPIM